MFDRMEVGRAAHKRFRGLMTKHHLVQMRPVAINAAFCVRERDSAGRAKSAAPARTRPHWMGVSAWQLESIFFHILFGESQLMPG